MQTSELKRRAKEQLRGKWGLAIGTVLVAQILLNINSINDGLVEAGIESFSTISSILTIALTGVISLGLCKFLLNLATDTEEAKFEDLFSGFNVYAKALGLNILIGLCVVAGLIFLIIPGVILALMFSQSYYILAEDPSKSIKQCMQESVDLMKGHKWEYFYLGLTFIGWGLLIILTVGIAAIWVVPYMSLTQTNFYLYLKNNS